MYEVWLNGMGLQDIDRSIRITEVAEEMPTLALQFIDNCGGDGQRLASRRCQSRRVKISFVVNERNPMRRRQLLDEVLLWVKDGALTTSAREEQYLNVRYSTLPNIASVKSYADGLSVTFTALEPYWQASTETTAEVTTVANTQKSVSLCPSGTAGSTSLAFDIKNTSTGVLNTASVTVNGRSFWFEALGLEAGKTLLCDCDRSGFLRLMVEKQSKMNKRTAPSADQLLLTLCASNYITVKTDQAANVKLRARGQWR